MTIEALPRETLLDIHRRAKLMYQADEKFRAMILGGELAAPVPLSPVLEKAFLYSRADIEAAVHKTLGV